MRILLPAAFLVFCSAAVEAQTKKIAHRSHSGADITFSWEQTPDNFGETPEMIEAAKKRARADSTRRKEIADSIRQRVIADSLQRIKKKSKPKKDSTRPGS